MRSLIRLALAGAALAAAFGTAPARAETCHVSEWYTGVFFVQVCTEGNFLDEPLCVIERDSALWYPVAESSVCTP